MTSILTEVCVDSVDGVAAAAAAGADRVELCLALSEGGLTPSTAMIEESLKVAGDTAVNVLIRLRGGDFCYSATEVQVMAQDIRVARDLGAHAVVIGALTPSGQVDERALSKLLAQIGSMNVTFHRAIDMSVDPIAALRTLRKYPIGKVLTSGSRPTALAGADIIRHMVAEAGDSLTILAGGGVRAHNVAELIADTGVTEVHFTAFVSRDSPMTYRTEHLSLSSDGSDYTRRHTDVGLIREMIEKVASGRHRKAPMS